MAYIITKFRSETEKQGGIVKQYEHFEDLAKEFKECRKGGKLGSGFIRCETIERKDSDCKPSRLLIIDGDESEDGSNAPSPRQVHLALKELGYNHFIYTSHSHSKDKNKYRVVIAADEYDRNAVTANNSAVLLELKARGKAIKHVKEMNSFSQIWFNPRRDDPEDGLYRFYGFFKGKDWESITDVQESETETKKDQEETEKTGGSESLEQMHENIRTGREYHESLRTLSYQYIADGMSTANAKAILKSIMNSSKDAGSDRWQTRYDDIDRMVDGAIGSSVASSIADLDLSEPETIHNPPPMPDGLLGKFITELKEFMLYEDDTIAFAAGMFILTSIVGRTFNVDIHSKDGLGAPTALNMYFTLAAETGVGKSEIENAVERTFMEFSGVNGSIRDFFYKGRVTGPRALYRIYKSQRSVGVIANEAGIEGKSSLGDKQGLNSAWLNLYGQGAWNKYTSASELSDSDNSIESIRAVAISRVSESTPVELMSYYRQGASVENGLIPRENMFIIKEINTKANRNIRSHYSKDIRDKMEHLVSICHKNAGEDLGFKPYVISVDDSALLAEMFAMQERLRTRQSKGNTMHERALSGRMFVKMLRYAGIWTVFNVDKEDKDSLTITRSGWSWAVRVVEDEYDKINDVVALTSGNNVMDELIDYTAYKLGQIINGTIKVNDCRVDPEMRRSGIIPTTKVKKAVRSNPQFKDLEGDPKFSGMYKSGIDKVLEYMAKIGYIEVLKKNPLGRGAAIKVLDGLVEHLENRWDDGKVR